MKSLVITAIIVASSLLNCTTTFAQGWLSKATGGRINTPQSIQRLGDHFRPSLIENSSWQPVEPKESRSIRQKRSSLPKGYFGDGSDFEEVRRQREQQKRMEQQRRQQQQAHQNMMNMGNQIFQQRQQMWGNVARQAEQLKQQFSNPNFGRPQYQQPQYQPYRPQYQPYRPQPQYPQNHYNQYSNRGW